jgi:hypothetical protein
MAEFAPPETNSTGRLVQSPLALQLAPANSQSARMGTVTPPVEGVIAR